MKLLVIIIMLIALFLLYRIAYPKQISAKKDDVTPNEKPKSLPNVMGKSRFVLSDRSKPLQTPATISETEKEVEKEPIFAAKTEEKQSVAIPAEQLDEVFSDDSNPEVMSLPLESENENEDESEVDLEAEEAEEIRQALGHEAIFADGIDYDNLQTVVKVVREQPDEVSEEICKILAVLENTDMFEMLVSGDEGITNWVLSAVERNIQSMIPETEKETSDTTDYGDFVTDFLVGQ